MSVTVLPSSKWQPSVLHLLPFSPNDAGAPSSASSLTSTGGAPTPSYIHEEARGFPALAISHTDREKLRSKSAGVHDNKSSSKKSRQFLDRPHSLHEKGVACVTSTSKVRAKSHYSGTSIDRKPESVKFSINDINEQILGRNYQLGDKSSESSDSVSHRGDMSETRLRPLPKPALRSRDGRWPNARFWRSSCISPGELELQKHKHNLDIQNPTTRKTKRVKLNVKDLPRSKTPVGENDPDKLNMKHVIAFLQKNADLRDARDNDDSYETKTPLDNHFSSNSALLAKENNNKDENHDRNNNNSYRALTSSSQNETPTASTPKRTIQIAKASNNSNENPTRTVTDQGEERGSDQNEDSQIPLAINTTGMTVSKLGANPGAKTNTSRSDNIARSVAYLPHQHKHDDIDYDFVVRPKSLNVLHETTAFRLPANLRHIRDSAPDMKPFRLHRFLTLVSNTSGSVNMPPVSKTFKDLNRSTDNDNYYNIGTSQYRGQSSVITGNSLRTRSSSKNSKIDSKHNPHHTHPKRSKSEARRHHYGSSESKEGFSERIRRRARSQESHYPNESSIPLPRNMHKIICLPVAPLDADSDDDYNPHPTVPTRLDRQGLTLSAQGRAIIAQYFPQSAKHSRNGMRPHSVKDVLHWAKQKTEQSSTVGQQRPHSMKNLKRDGDEGGTLAGKDSDIKNGVEADASPQTTDWGQNISSEAINGDFSSAGEDTHRTSDGGIKTPKQQQYQQQQQQQQQQKQQQQQHQQQTTTTCPPSPTKSEGKSQHSTKSKSSSDRNGLGNGIVTFPTEVINFEDDDDDENDLRKNAMDFNTKAWSDGGNNKHGITSARTKTDTSTSPSGDPVKLTLRKERNLTRELTYMVDMELSSPRGRKT